MIVILVTCVALTLFIAYMWVLEKIDQIARRRVHELSRLPQPKLPPLKRRPFDPRNE